MATIPTTYIPPLNSEAATAAASAAKQDTGNTSLASIDSKMSLADVDYTTIINSFGTLATSAKQDTGNTSLASIDTKLTHADTDYTTIINNFGTLATSANQATEITWLGSIDGKVATAANQVTESGYLNSIYGKLNAVCGTTAVNIQQNVVADTNNSYSSNLTAGAVFYGTATSTLGVAGLQISLATTQNCTVYVDQSPEGTNWDISDSFNYYTSVGNFGVTVQAVNSYIRVRVKNTGAATTIAFRLQTCLCPIVEAVPRALDADQNFKVAVKSNTDMLGFTASNTPTGNLRVTEPTRIIGASFDGTTVDPNFWSAFADNSATVTQANAEVTLNCGSNSAGAAQMTTFRRARYVSAQSSCCRMIIQLSDTGLTDNTRRWGIAYGSNMPASPTATDGAYFELSGTTFSVVTLKGGVATPVSSGFNGNIGNGAYTPATSVTTYEIYWTNSSVWFVVNGVLFHKVSASSATWANTMSHYIYFYNVNSGNTTSATLKVRVASLQRMGGLLTQPHSKYQAGQTAGVVCKYGPGNLHAIVVSGIVTTSVVNVYDGLSSAGSLIWSSGAMTIGAQSNNFPYFIDLYGLPFFNGLTVAVTTANCNVLAVYE